MLSSMGDFLGNQAPDFQLDEGLKAMCALNGIDVTQMSEPEIKLGLAPMLRLAMMQEYQTGMCNGCTARDKCQYVKVVVGAEMRAN